MPTCAAPESRAASRCRTIGAYRRWCRARSNGATRCRRSETYPDLDVLTAGPASRRAADRLGTVLDKLLGEAEKDYDLVIVDAPPLLGFAEPLQMAAVVDGVVVITMAGQTNRKAVESVLSSLKRIKTNVIGVVLERGPRGHERPLLQLRLLREVLFEILQADEGVGAANGRELHATCDPEWIRSPC